MTITEDIAETAQAIKDRMYDKLDRWEGNPDTMTGLIADIAAALVAERERARSDGFVLAAETCEAWAAGFYNDDTKQSLLACAKDLRDNAEAILAAHPAAIPPSSRGPVSVR